MKWIVYNIWWSGGGMFSEVEGVCYELEGV